MDDDLLNVCECCGSLKDRYTFLSMQREVNPVLKKLIKDKPEKFSESTRTDVLENEEKYNSYSIPWRNEFFWPLVHYHYKVEAFSKDCVNHFQKIFQRSVEGDNLISLEELTLQEEGAKKILEEVDIPVRNSKEKTVLITCIYDEKDDVRFDEIKLCLKKNLENKNIDKIILFLENSNYVFDRVDPNSKSTIKSFLPLINKLEIEDIYKHKVDIVFSQKRISYADAFKYVKLHGDEESVYILSNSDCFFDESSYLLKKIDYDREEKLLLAITRKEMLEDGTIIEGRRLCSTERKGEYVITKKQHDIEEKPKMPPFSSDAWVFSKKTAENVQTNFSRLYLGTLHCEQQFLSALKLENFKLYNVGFHGFVNCIHVHNSHIRYAKKIKAITFHPKMSLRLPYRMGGQIRSWNKVKRDLGGDTDGLITKTTIKNHESNYLFDNQYDFKFGKFVVRDIRELFKYH